MHYNYSILAHIILYPFTPFQKPMEQDTENIMWSHFSLTSIYLLLATSTTEVSWLGSTRFSNPDINSRWRVTPWSPRAGSGQRNAEEGGGGGCSGWPVRDVVSLLTQWLGARSRGVKDGNAWRTSSISGAYERTHARTRTQSSRRHSLAISFVSRSTPGGGGGWEEKGEKMEGDLQTQEHVSVSPSSIDHLYSR